MLLKILVKNLLKTVIRLLSKRQVSLLACLGFPNLIDRHIDFLAVIRGTQFKIQANTKYPIEVAATRRFGASGAQLFLTNLDLNGKTVIDVGANVGTTALMLLHSGAAVVHAIEPGPLFKRLEKNIEINSVSDRVIAHNFGIAMSKKWLSWHEDLSNLGNAHLLPLGTKKQFLGSLSRESKKVACKTLDKFCFECVEDAVHFIKIDVEGMELEVLKSGAKMIEHDKPIIFVETNPDQIENNKLVEIFMKQMRYEKINDCRPSARESCVSKLTNDTIYIPGHDPSLLLNWRKILRF